jgi:hypothetical protein
MRANADRRRLGPKRGEAAVHVLNTCLYLGFRADLADREEARMP